MPSIYAGRRFLVDTETNGLLKQVSKMHCAVAIDLDTEEVLDFRPHQIGMFLELIKEADLIVGHNVIGYDCAVIEKLFGIPVPPPSKLIDTLNLARLVFPDIKSSDMPVAKKWKKWKAAYDAWAIQERYKAIDSLTALHCEQNGLTTDEVTKAEREAIKERAYAEELGNPLHLGPPPKEFPGQFVGAHSLEAWGYRLGGTRKGDYSKEMKAKGLDPWEAWNEDMHDYMLDDGQVNLELFKHLMSFKPSPQSILLEMRVQRLISQVERNGWPFDVRAGQELYMTLCAERDELQSSLRTLFPPWTVQLEDFIPKRDNKTKGYLKGVPVPRSEVIEFNPGSREHIANRLGAKYGWEPASYTASGKPQVDDDVLMALDYPEAQALARFFTVQKRIGQLAEGPQAWLKVVTAEGKIHGRYTINGAVTGRCTHSSPNIAQVPSIVNAKGLVPFGEECRALFTVMDGFSQLGGDQAGLELRCLGSFMAAFDKGAYRDIVLNGDVHWGNAKALMGWPADLVLDKENQAHKDARSLAKTFIYAMLYGSGDFLLGELAPPDEAELNEWRASPEHMDAVRKLKAYMIAIANKRGEMPPTKKELQLTYKGSLLRERLMVKFPALAKLIKAVKTAAKKGWLKGLDGRVLPVRSPHAALNVLLQSAGAIICKQWIADVEDALSDAGLKHGWDGDYAVLGWVHDELQIAVRKGHEALVERLLIEAARKAGDPFPTWSCPTDGDVKTGRNWAECH